MISHKEKVFDALRHLGTGMLPRGELFLPSDVLNHYFPEQKDEYTKQLASTARLLGLSLLGVDLCEERHNKISAEKNFKELDQFFIVGCINGPVSHMIFHLGFFEGMLSIKKSPHRLNELNESFIKGIKKKCLIARDNGFCAIAVTDDIATNNGILVSPADLTNKILPIYGQIARIVKSAGLLAFFHSDGNTESIIEPLIEAGYDCIHPVDSQAGMDLYEMKKAFGEKISFMGHVDIAAWGPKRIFLEISRAEKEFEKGGLILGSSCGITPGATEEVLTALYPDVRNSQRRVHGFA